MKWNENEDYIECSRPFVRIWKGEDHILIDDSVSVAELEEILSKAKEIE